jgi:hypothetical protein
MALASLMVLVLVPACKQATTDAVETKEPYSVEPIEGTDVARVILTEDGAARIGLETAAVEDADGMLRVPESAVWIDVDGTEWVYTNPEGLVYVRAEVEVDRYVNGTAVLKEGPPIGTEVVSVGVAELIGSEFGI